MSAATSAIDAIRLGRPLNADEIDRIDAALLVVREELIRATELHGPMRSGHEGFAVIFEEVDELWDEVKANCPGLAATEAIQVAAMAVRFFVDLRPKVH